MEYQYTVKGDLGLYADSQGALVLGLVTLLELPSAPAAIISIAAAGWVMGAHNIYYSCDVYFQREPYSAQKRVYTFYADSSRSKKIGSYTLYREYILDRVEV